MYSTYKKKLNSLSPVAIKLGQIDVHAPQHDTWGIVTCDICGERFAIGPNRIYGARISEEVAVQQFEKILVADHTQRANHRDCYELVE